MGQLYGATLLPFGAICVVFLWESGASSIRTTLAVDTSRVECPDNKILTVEYPCVRAGGKNSTCFRDEQGYMERDILLPQRELLLGKQQRNYNHDNLDWS